MVAISSLLFAPAAQARADFITLFNTGVDAAGNPLSGGAVDSHWYIVPDPNATAIPKTHVVNNQLPGTYFQDADSRWIWVNADGRGGPITYTFRLTFDLTGLDPATAVITGDWGVDNNGMIVLNGSNKFAIKKGETNEVALIGVNPVNYAQFHHFSITGLFVAGLNTLDFVATDADGLGALNVTNLVGTADPATPSAVPEPASMTVFTLGALCLLSYAWSRRRTISV